MQEQSKLAQEQQKTAQAQQEAAEAQLALKKHLDAVAAHQADRSLSRGFRSVREITVAEKDRGNIWRVFVLYKAGDDEAFRFGQEITRNLRGAGWSTDGDEARPTTKDESIDPTLRAWFPSVRPGITIVIPRQAGKFKMTMVTVLVEDFTAAGFSPYVAPDWGANTSVTVIVGSKVRATF